MEIIFKVLKWTAKAFADGKITKEEYFDLLETLLPDFETPVPDKLKGKLNTGTAPLQR